MKYIAKLFFMMAVVATIAGSFTFYNHIAQASNVDICAFLIDDINNLRAGSGLNTLTVDSGLTEIAKLRAKEAASKWSHERPNGHMGFELVPGNIWKGENLSFVDVENMSASNIEKKHFQDLCMSSSHLANMLFEYYNRIGVASYTAEDGKMYVAYIFAA